MEYNNIKYKKEWPISIISYSLYTSYYYVPKLKTFKEQNEFTWPIHVNSEIGDFLNIMRIKITNSEVYYQVQNVGDF